MFPPGGYLAVSFFFVLSGFSMTIGYRDRVNQLCFSYSSYITKRLTKFFPIHWLILFYIVFTQFSNLVKQDFFWAKLTVNFLLLQSFVPLKDFYFSFNSPSWYLCNTLFYCLLFPFILRFICNSSKKRKIIIIVTLVFLYVLLVIIVPKPYHHAVLYVNPFVRIIDFVIGIYTGLFFLKQYEKFQQGETLKYNNVWLLLVTILCFVIVAFLSFYNIDSIVKSYIVKFYWLIFSPMIFTVSLKSVVWKKTQRGGLINSTLQSAGKYSFTFYMIHFVCIGFFDAICTKYGVTMWGKVFITYFATLVFAILCQKIFVEPVGNFLNNYLNNKRHGIYKN